MNESENFGMKYYDPEGNEIDILTWGELFDKRTHDPDTSWWKKLTVISEEIHISSVWIGMPQGLWFGKGPPLIYETMIFGGPHDQKAWHYATKQECWDDHDRIVEELLTLEPVLPEDEDELPYHPLDHSEETAPNNNPDSEAWFHTW